MAFDCALARHHPFIWKSGQTAGLSGSRTYAECAVRSFDPTWPSTRVASHRRATECRLKPGFLMKQGSGRVYVDLEDHAILDLDKQSVLLQASEVGELLARGQLLITLNGEASLPNLVLAGFMAQRISTALYPYSIGSC